MPVFTDWRDCNEIVDAIGLFFHNTAFRMGRHTYWFESTKELLSGESNKEAPKTVGVWTTADILYICSVASGLNINSPQLNVVAKDALGSLVWLVKARRDACESFSYRHFKVNDVESLVESQEARNALASAIKAVSERAGMSRNITFKQIKPEYDGPSHTVASASVLRALCQALKSGLCDAGIDASENKCKEQIAWLVDCLTSFNPNDLSRTLTLPNALNNPGTKANTIKHLSNLLKPPPQQQSTGEGGSWTIKIGCRTLTKEFACWAPSAVKETATPDIITTAYVLDALSAAVSIDVTGQLSQAKLKDIISASLCNYLIPSIKQKLCQAQQVSKTSDIPSQDAWQQIANVESEHLTYSDLSRLVISLSNILSNIELPSSDCTVDDAHRILHALVAKLVEKTFIDLAIFGRLPYDRMATQFVSGSEVEEWPGVDVSFIAAALLLAVKHSGQCKLAEHTAFAGYSSFFKRPFDISHPIVRVVISELESQVLASSDISKQTMYMHARPGGSSREPASLQRFIGGMVWGGTQGEDLYAYEDIYSWASSYALLAFSIYLNEASAFVTNAHPESGKTFVATPILLSGQSSELSTLRLELANLKQNERLIPIGKAAEKMKELNVVVIIWGAFLPIASVIHLGSHQHPEMSLGVGLDWGIGLLFSIVLFALWGNAMLALRGGGSRKLIWINSGFLCAMLATFTLGGQFREVIHKHLLKAFDLPMGWLTGALILLAILYACYLSVLVNPENWDTKTSSSPGKVFLRGLREGVEKYRKIKEKSPLGG